MEKRPLPSDQPLAPAGTASKAELSTILDDYNLEDVHEILTRAGLYLPAKSGHWLTKKQMLAMYRGDQYAVTWNELKPQPCPRPPTRQELVDEVNKEIVKRTRDSGKCYKTTANRMPEGAWLLNILSALNPSHPVFKKSYMPDRQPDPNLEVKVAHLKQMMDIAHPVFKDQPLTLLVRRKSLKSLAPAQM